MASIQEITSEQAHPLRRAVLRAGIPNPDVRYPQDDDPRSFHLGVFVGENLVGVGTFTPANTPYRPNAAAWQLRGMAVADGEQRTGIGALLIGAAVARCRSAGVEVLWCNARDAAAPFYARLGFTTHGDGFNTVDTGLPHHVMVLDL